MKLSDAFPSKYLSAGDLNGKEVTVTISSYSIENLAPEGQPMEQKPVLTFVGAQKAFALNVTNGNLIGELYGDDLDDWVGKPITLYPTKVDFKGKRVPAVRVKVDDGPPVADAPIPDTTPPGPEDDDVPF